MCDLAFRTYAPVFSANHFTPAFCSFTVSIALEITSGLSLFFVDLGLINRWP